MKITTTTVHFVGFNCNSCVTMHGKMYSRLTLLIKNNICLFQYDREHVDRIFGRIVDFIMLNHAVYAVVRTVI
jgi:hypothetical protein